MADRRTNGANFFETNLTAVVGPTDLTYNVAANTITSPAFIVINPTIPAQREVILADGAFTGTQFSSSAIGSRYQQGSAAASGLTHDSGAKVWVAPLWQHVEDLNDRIEGRALAGHGHVFDGAAHDAHDHTTALGTAALADLADVAATAPATNQGLLWNGTAWAPGNVTSHDLIGEVTINPDGAATFLSIPATYRHLRVVVHARSTLAAGDDGLMLRFNDDSTATYDFATLRQVGTVVDAVEGYGATAIRVGRVAAASAPAGEASPVTIDIPDYARTTWRKSLTSRSGVDRTGAAGGMTQFNQSGFWRNTAAINRVSLFAEAGLLATGSVVTLYGVKGA